MRQVAGVVMVLVASLGLGGAATAQPYPPVEAAVTCEATTTEAGQSVVCEGSGFEPGSDVDVEVVGPDGERVSDSTVQADSDGVARSPISFGSDLEAGEYEVAFVGADTDGAEAAGTQVVQVRTDIEDSAGGMSLVVLLVVLLILLILGGGAVFAWRQRSGGARTSD